jgi:arylsulfatase A-like enzyme
VPGLAPRVIDEPSMSIDIPPMILGALGLPVDERMQGTDLLRTSAAPRAIWSEVYDPLAHKYSLRDAKGWKLIHGPTERELLFPNEKPWELYRLDEDPGEATDLWTDEPDRAARMSDALRELRGGFEALGEALGARGEGELDEITREQLKALGYGGG